MNGHFTNAQTANRNTTILSASLVVREMQMKSTPRYCYVPTRVAKTKDTANTKCWQGCRATGTLVHCCWKHRMVQPLWNTGLAAPYKVNLNTYHTTQQIRPHEDLQAHVQGSFIPNGQKVEITPTSMPK